VAVYNVALRFNAGEKLLDVSALTKGECIPDSVHSIGTYEMEASANIT